MTFERYMGMCLYHPEFGYYTQGRERTGVAGDYFTSPDLHPVFARLVARQAAEMWNAMGRPQPFTWVEMGAGRGLFASDFLSWSAGALPEFAAALDYVAIEPWPLQRQRIEARLAGMGAKGKARMLANLDELAPVTGCFFSNELVDAFPVSVVTRTGGRLKEIYVIAEGDGLREKLGPISDPAVAAYVARYAHQLEEGHRMEVNRQAQAWMRAVAAKLKHGFVLTIDYGDLANRLFTVDRPSGTLLAYRGHTAAEDFFSAPGETDLTAHVNFSALIDAGKAARPRVRGVHNPGAISAGARRGQPICGCLRSGSNRAGDAKRAAKAKKADLSRGNGKHLQGVSPAAWDAEDGAYGMEVRTAEVRRQEPEVRS